MLRVPAAGPFPCRLMEPPDPEPEGTISQRAKRAGRGPYPRAHCLRQIPLLGIPSPTDVQVPV